MRRSPSGRLVAGLVLIAFAFTATAEDSATRSDPGELVREIESWRAERLAALKKPGSYLTLVGLAWLNEGENVCGSDPESDVVLPASAPGRIGVFHVRPGRVEFVAEPGAGVLHEGESFERMTLASDAGGNPTLLSLGTVSFHVIDRGGRLGVRVKDEASPVYTDFRGLEYFPIDDSWRLEGRFEAYDPPRQVKVPNILGTPIEQPSPGAVTFNLAGQTYRLEALPGSDENELFLIFGDKTNGRETYGGGRFLYARLEGEGRAVVDFNRAYNPACVFTAYSTCPMPLPGNKLPIPVPAGEKVYRDASH